MATPLAQAGVSAPAVSQAALPLTAVAVVDENPPPRKPACVECRRRKIKCDREYPCLSCMTLGQECLPPPPGPLRKPRRRNHHELYDKIARIESLLSQHGVHPDPESEPGPGPGPESGSGPSKGVRDPHFGPSPFQTGEMVMEGVRESAEAGQPRAPVVAKGQLVQTWNGGLEFRDSKAMAVVFEDNGKFHTISALIDVEFDQATWLPAVEVPHNGRRSLESTGSSSSPSSSAARLSAVCVPSAHTINVLWDVFLDRVDPVTKIIHAPTFRMRVVEAASNFTNTPLATLALLFSVFLTASGSLSEQEHWEKLGLCKGDAVAEYSLGLKRALTEMNYLKNHNLDVLRSLTLYSLFQQTRYGSHDPWVLNGVVVNIAYRMRLHLDGSHAGLSPFECEMRRRLWWQIVILELRSGGAFGTGSHLLPGGRDTRIPLNVNDEDLIPAMIVEPRARDGPTEMSFCIMTYEAKKHVLALPRLLSIDDVLWSGSQMNLMPSPTHSYGINSSNSPSTGRSETIKLLQTFMQEEQRTLGPLEDRLCPDPDGNPLHAMARWGRAALSRIARLIMTPMEEASEWGTEVHGPDDNFFRISLAANEEALLARRAAGRRFAWHADIDFRMQNLYYLGAQLRTRLAGSMADRVWAVMERTYALRAELWELKAKENMTLGNLLLAAWERRVACFAVEGVVLAEPPFLTRLRDEVMTIKAEALGIF